MKKLFGILLTVLLGLSLVACSSSNEGATTGLANPIKDYDSIEEINEITGVHVVLPSSIDATDIKYQTINDETAQVVFMLDGHKWTLRGSKTVDQDISGIHDDNNQFISGQDFGMYINDYYLDRMFTENIQYTIVMDTDGEYYDEMKFSDYVFTIETALRQASDPTGISGSYQDSTSQRATMEISKYDEYYDIIVSWPDSSNQLTMWSISGTLEDNKINYRGEDISKYSYDSEGNEEYLDSTAINNVGYFEIKDEKLYWTGAGQDNCKDCVFEKIPF